MEIIVQICNACGMRIEEGRSVHAAGKSYCCEGCAEGTGCACQAEE